MSSICHVFYLPCLSTSVIFLFVATAYCEFYLPCLVSAMSTSAIYLCQAMGGHKCHAALCKSVMPPDALVAVVARWVWGHVARRTGVMFLAILTGFRDLNQGVGADIDSPADRLVAPTHCGTWVNIDQGWKRLARCVEWAACDLDQPSPNPGPLSEQAGQGGKGGTHQPTVPDACRRARCLCLSSPPPTNPSAPPFSTAADSRSARA